MSTPSHERLTPSAASRSYPRAFLLGIYTAAIEQGWVYISPVAEADYPSLKAQLLRLRRRADTSNKSFITPDHYLVTFSPWEPGPDGRGRVAAMYSDMPEGLPELSRRDGSSLEVPTTAPAASPTPANPELLSEKLPADMDMALSELDIDDFVSKMVRESGAADV